MSKPLATNGKVLAMKVGPLFDSIARGRLNQGTMGGPFLATI